MFLGENREVLGSSGGGVHYRLLRGLLLCLYC